MRLRALSLGGALLALFGVVLARAAKVQLLDRSRLSRLQRDQTRRELEWQPRRGMIVDRRGEPLAVTRDVDSIFADPAAFETPRARAAAATRLSAALRMDRARLLEKLAQPDRRFVWIKRRIDEAAAERVRALGIDGIELVKEPKRFYPQRELAGHVLGFVGDESGQEGLERELDSYLRGKSVQVQATRDAHGAMVLEHGVPDPGDLTGATVTLTLDSAIQLAAEKELAKAVQASHAVGGWALVLDVNSGAVLALAANPAFDANKPGRDPMIWRDRAVQDQLEPGSTIKSFVLAKALAEGVLRPEEKLFCEEGVWAAAGRKIHDTHPVGWATPATVLRESSNICAAKIGEKLGKERLIEGLRAFGFGEKTGVGLPGEAKGALADPRRMPQIALYTTAFGQGMSATGIQTVAAMAAIANGGVLLRPYLLAKVVASDGTPVLTRGREEVRRVLRPQTARQLTEMLEEVVEKGTGTRAALAGHRAAGKTGTAQKVDPIHGGYSDKRLASFLGFAPADAPRVAILVAIDEPEGKGAEIAGGMVAAPAWGAIAHEALRQLEVMPEQAKEAAPVLASTLGPAALPAAEAAVPEAEPALRPGQARVPDVSGLGARSATRRLAQASLEPELRGSGRAVAQSPR
ncbi:MAG TPA: penicillin-binding transpeptidase domain-containing protein, partial [Myxococcales bacterium]|nr:penicillin-binding transpeptidase domain-containing protein [Myxococcales bacterium]